MSLAEPLVLNAVLSLSRAALCLDDDTIFPMTDGRCPRCGSRGWVLLSRWLGERR